MKASELRKKTVAELENEQLAMQRELFNLRMQRGTGQQPKPDSFRKAKRGIALLKTILREKEGL